MSSSFGTVCLVVVRRDQVMGAGFAVFGSFVAPESIAAIGHATWDAIHYVRDKVVSRSLTEFCFVLDLGLGVALLLTTWNLLPV